MSLGLIYIIGLLLAVILLLFVIKKPQFKHGKLFNGIIAILSIFMIGYIFIDTMGKLDLLDVLLIVFFIFAFVKSINDFRLNGEDIELRNV